MQRNRSHWTISNPLHPRGKKKAHRARIVEMTGYIALKQWSPACRSKIADEMVARGIPWFPLEGTCTIPEHRRGRTNRVSTCWNSFRGGRAWRVSARATSASEDDGCRAYRLESAPTRRIGASPINHRITGDTPRRNSPRLLNSPIEVKKS